MNHTNDIMKKSISIAALTAITASALGGAVATQLRDYRPRKDVIEPTVMATTAELSTPTPSRFAKETPSTTAPVGIVPLPHTLSQDELYAAGNYDSSDFLGSYYGRADRNTRSATRGGSYTASTRRLPQGRVASNRGNTTRRQDAREGNYASTRTDELNYCNNRMYNCNYRSSDYNRYNHSRSDYRQRCNDGYCAPFEGRNVYKVTGDVYIVMPDTSFMDRDNYQPVRSMRYDGNTAYSNNRRADNNRYTQSSRYANNRHIGSRRYDNNRMRTGINNTDNTPTQTTQRAVTRQSY